MKTPTHNAAYLRRALAILGLSILASAARAQGGPPLVTDDPGTPGNKHWEINMAYTNSKFGYGRVQELPHLDLNYGYGDNVQLKLEGPLTIFNGQGSDFSTLGYTQWGVKWRFQEETKNRPAVSTYPQLLFLANKTLANLDVLDPGMDLFLPIEAMKTFGALQLDAETGVLFRQYTTNQISSGICGSYDLSKSLSLLGEVHDVTSTRLVRDQLLFNLGFKFDFNEHSSLLFSTGRGFGSPTDDTPSFLTYVGIQFRI